MLLSLPYLHGTIKLGSPKFPKPVITFLIANVFTSAIKNVMTCLRDSGATVGLSAILRKIQFLSVIGPYSASKKLSCNIYIHVQKHHI